MEIKVVTPKFNDTERRENIPAAINSQIDSSTETHNETVKVEFFETPRGRSTRESITTNTNNKSRSRKTSAPKEATQQTRDSLVETTGRSEGKEFSNRSIASTSQNVTE